MCVCFQLILVLCGMIALAVGRFPIGKTVIVGTPARLLGVACFLPLLLGTGGGLLLYLVVVALAASLGTEPSEGLVAFLDAVLGVWNLFVTVATFVGICVIGPRYKEQNRREGRTRREEDRRPLRSRRGAPVPQAFGGAGLWRITCPCKQLLLLSASMLGTCVRCPRCNTVLHVRGV